MPIKSLKYLILFISVLSLIFSCKEAEMEGIPHFELVDKSYTGIDFNNELDYTEKLNPYTFRNFYNGGGVAIGDINNDGLVDILLTGNQVENKLYLNKGDFQFEDITAQAGLAGKGIWSTGVSMADVNGDGFVDIFICKSGPLEVNERFEGKRHNELFINNGDLTFTEMAEAYGLADVGLSQHAVFFDYDGDGDLDMYLLSNSPRSVGINDLREGQREVRDPFGGNKLYRNDGEKFRDVSEEAGIYGSAIGYGLGVTVADINKDGWPDLYVSNDFFEKDYLYINNGDGTFDERLEAMMTEISMGSMGADIADLDNDGWPDIFVTEMLPSDLQRVKTKTPFEEWDKYQTNVKAGYFHQFTRNTLQRNLGFKPKAQEVHFAEVARFAGVHSTDWSWGALIFDVDNDGLRDIFVANGIVKDLTDFDYVDYYVNNQNLISQYKKDSVLLTKMIDQFPSVPQRNFLFKNKGGFHFEDIADRMGMDQLTFSTGAAYADLDNDGDLDLVINNLNEEVSIFRNNANHISRNNFLQLDLGSYFGTKVSIFAGEQSYYGEHFPVKGYMSSVDHRMQFGLGKYLQIDSLIIDWPHGNKEIFQNIEVNQLVKLRPGDGVIVGGIVQTRQKNQTLFQLSPQQIVWRHKESEFVDFDKERLRFHMISNEGPRIAVGDLNADGLDDLVLPGAKGQATTIWTQTRSGEFELVQEFIEDTQAEDVEALLFDANGDGYLDLYLASGSIEYNLNSDYYQDRLYLNDQKGKFLKTSNHLPRRNESTSFVKSFDYNGDGYLDLIVGGRSLPYAYGVPLDVRLLENDGEGKFQDVTSEKAAGFLKLGMTRDAAIVDLDGDGDLEIIIVGDWMPIKVFKNTTGKYIDVSKSFGLENTNGLWNTISVLDFDNDGFPDFIVGNEGLNSRLLASEARPMRLYVNDFDQNGSVEQILTQYEGVNAYPMVLKSPLLKQLPGLRKKLLDYDAYKDKTMDDLFSKEILEKSLILEVHTLATQMFINKNGKAFEKSQLPHEVQYSPIHAIHVERNETQDWEILLAGNQSKVKPEIGVNMGSYGWLMKQSGDSLVIEMADKSGLYVTGEVRSIHSIGSNKGKKYLFARNNQEILTFEKLKVK